MKQTFRGTHKAVLLAVIILSAFIFFMFATIWSYHVGAEMGATSFLTPLLQYHTAFMISMGAIGIVVGASVFYLMSQKVEKTQITAKHSSEVFLRFLTREEQQVVQKLVDSKGKILQSQLSRELNISRLKVHRIMVRLSEKGVIDTREYGKTNTVILHEDIYNSLRVQ
jgi:uncharacterized membrane protein